MTSETDTTVWFNPVCSKCRTTQGILQELGIDATYVRYLETAPARTELVRVLALLGADGPRAIARTGESLWTELGLADATDDQILDAMVEHPILIERPIVIRGDRAVIGRPPENVLSLLTGGGREVLPSVCAAELTAERSQGPHKPAP